MANNNTNGGLQGMQTTAAAGNLYTANTAIQKQNTETQLAARFGGSRKKLKGGAIVPPVKISYVDRGVGNTNTGNNVTASAETTLNLNAQAKLDSEVGAVQPIQKAGRRKSRRLVGGWPEWGCMSGGRKRRRSRKQRLRKSCRSRKLRKNSYRRRKSK